MSSVFTPTRMRITVDRYQKMVTTGVLSSSDHVELIEGDILERAPVTPRHASVTARLLKRLTLAVGAAADVRASNPVDLGDCSEPEPDLVILKPRANDYARAHPQVQDVMLLNAISMRALASVSTGSSISPMNESSRIGVRSKVYSNKSRII
jgi:hypothetical protein